MIKKVQVILTEEQFYELNELRIKMNLRLPSFPKSITFDTYEEYLEDCKKNPLWVTMA